MLSHKEMIGLQSESHELIEAEKIRNKEDYVLQLIHATAYEYASKIAQYKRVLDIGCNTGYGSKIISKSCREIVGVDVSQKAISFAENLYGQFGITFKLINGKSLPFEDNSFDLIVSFQVIEHIVNYQDFISEIKRVLTPDGIVLFTTPNAQIRLDPGMKPWNPFHVREFSANVFENVLSAYFSEARVYGLFADEPIYSIEYNRLIRARDTQRKRQRKSYSLYYNVRSLVKKLLPDKLVEKLKNVRDSLKRGKNYNKLDTEFQNLYGIDSFYYSECNYETALDLLAVCSDNKNNLEKNLKKIRIRHT